MLIKDGSNSLTYICLKALGSPPSEGGKTYLVGPDRLKQSQIWIFHVFGHLLQISVHLGSSEALYVRVQQCRSIPSNFFSFHSAQHQCQASHSESLQQYQCMQLRAVKYHTISCNTTQLNNLAIWRSMLAYGRHFEINLAKLMHYFQ